MHSFVFFFWSEIIDTVFIRLTALGAYLFLNLESGRLFEVGAHIRSWALIKFSPFSASAVSIFCNKTVNGNNKKQRCNKARFL